MSENVTQRMQPKRHWLLQYTKNLSKYVAMTDMYNVAQGLEKNNGSDFRFARYV